jgi:anionic cell wall polymer biosynthesis LytR-Cps2A-Psr (LCP) family protein
LNQLNGNIHTNIPLIETTVLEKFFQGFNLDNKKTTIISGNWTTINGIVYLIPNNETKEKMVNELGLRD